MRIQSAPDPEANGSSPGARPGEERSARNEEFEPFMAGLQKKQKKARVPVARQTRVSAPVAMPRQVVSRLARAGKHAKAIERATKALAAAGLTVAQKLDLLDIRAASYTAQGELRRAAADADTMLTLARRARKAAFRAQAEKRQTLVQRAPRQRLAASGGGRTRRAQTRTHSTRHWAYGRRTNSAPPNWR
jgi:hypothetical protein